MSFHTTRMKANLRARALPFRTPSPLALSALAACALASGCIPAPPASAPEPATSAPVPALRPHQSEPAPAPAPRPLGADWRDAPITPGDWTMHSPIGDKAEFGANLLNLTCEHRTGKVALHRRLSRDPSTHPSFDQMVPMTVITTFGQRTLSARLDREGYTAELDRNDPLLDEMAFSRGRFAVSVPGENVLYVPSWSEVSRVVESCR